MVVSMVFSMVFYGFSMVFLWFFHGFPWLSMAFHGFPSCPTRPRSSSPTTRRLPTERGAGKCPTGWVKTNPDVFFCYKWKINDIIASKRWHFLWTTKDWPWKNAENDWSDLENQTMRGLELGCFLPMKFHEKTWWWNRYSTVPFQIMKKFHSLRSHSPFDL